MKKIDVIQQTDIRIPVDDDCNVEQFIDGLSGHGIELDRITDIIYTIRSPIEGHLMFGRDSNPEYHIKISSIRGSITLPNKLFQLIYKIYGSTISYTNYIRTEGSSTIEYLISIYNPDHYFLITLFFMEQFTNVATEIPSALSKLTETRMLLPLKNCYSTVEDCFNFHDSEYVPEAELRKLNIMENYSKVWEYLQEIINTNEYGSVKGA